MVETCWQKEHLGLDALEAFATRLEAIGIRLEALAIRLENIAVRLEAIAIGICWHLSSAHLEH